MGEVLFEMSEGISEGMGETVMSVFCWLELEIDLYFFVSTPNVWVHQAPHEYLDFRKCIHQAPHEHLECENAYIRLLMSILIVENIISGSS